MNPLIQSKKTTILPLLIALTLVCFGLSPKARAVVPPPDGCYPNFNTAEGCDALKFLGAGTANTGLGWRALFFAGDSSFNTGVGAGALALTTTGGNANTAVGAAALLVNTTGDNNTAVGAGALVFNNTGSANTATGVDALRGNTTGSNNTVNGVNALNDNTTGSNNAAYGVGPLADNIDGNNNTAIGNLALENNTTNNNHVCVGRLAGSGITAVDNNIIIGHHSGVHSDFGQISNRCFIDNIHGAPVSSPTALAVFVDSDGRLGTDPMPAGADHGGFSPQGVQPQFMLNEFLKQQKRIAELEAMVTSLIATVKEQAAQIQKVSAQLELSQPAPQMVVNDQ